MKRKIRFRSENLLSAGAMAILTLFAGFNAHAQSNSDARKTLRGEAAFGDWREDQPGIWRLITSADLPDIAPEVVNLVELAPMPAGVMLQVPEGFKVEGLS